MLLRRATFHNIGPFKHWTLDVEDKRGVVALVAPNGTGKSTAVELALLGGPYRAMRTQGTLKGRATARDAYVESHITHGAPYTIKQFVDPLSKSSGEAIVLDAAGEPLWEGTKVSIYDEWARQTLLDDDVYLAGPFCAQKDDGLVSMKSSERIAVVLRAIGVARLERMAKAAGKRASKASDAFQALVTRIADARGGVCSVNDAAEALERARDAARDADAAVLAAKQALAARQQQAADHAVNRASREAAEKHLATLVEQRDAAQARAAAAERALAEASAILVDEQAIREAATRLPAAELELADLRGAWAAADAGVRGALDPWRDGAARRAAALKRAAAARTRLADESAILEAVAGLPAARAAADAARAARAAAEEVRVAFQKRDKVTDTARIAGLRAGLEEVADSEISDAKAAAERALRADDQAETDAVELPKQLAGAETALSFASERLAQAERCLAETERLAARELDLAPARADLAAAQQELDELFSSQAVAVISALARALERARLAAAGKAKADELAPLRTLAARLPALETARARIDELEPQGFADQAQAMRLTAEIAEIEKVEGAADLGEPPDVAGAERELAGTERAAKDSAAAVARAEQTLARAEETAARVAALEAERDAVAAELADWTRLELDLGRKGIQSAEVDSAGPELTELANALLHKCHGPQFTVMVETQRLSEDGKKVLEECTIRVIDSVKGTDKDISEHSGGEGVILGIAMRLALAMMASRRAGISDFTIVCDESGAALDPDNNRAFVAMLRHAIAVTGARHVLLVSHSEEVHKMCDHIIDIPGAA